MGILDSINQILGGGANFQPQGATETQANQSLAQAQGFNANLGTALASQQQLAAGMQPGIANQNTMFGQEQGLANQLQGVANGTGPNPAQMQLNQATGQNVANQAALMAGMRGGNANAGLMARQIGQQGAGIQQQAAGQAATLGAQQQLGAMGQLGGLQGQMVAQQQAALGQQANIANMQAQNAAGLYGTQLGSLGNQNNVNMQQALQAQKVGQQALGGGLQAAGTGLMQAMTPAAAATVAAAAAEGGVVPGKAEVNGDSYSNDTVPAMLSPGEIVLPRHVVQSSDPVAASAKFVEALLQKHSSGNDDFKAALKQGMQARNKGGMAYYAEGTPDAPVGQDTVLQNASGPVTDPYPFNANDLAENALTGSVKVAPQTPEPSFGQKLYDTAANIGSGLLDTLNNNPYSLYLAHTQKDAAIDQAAAPTAQDQEYQPTPTPTPTPSAPMPQLSQSGLYQQRTALEKQGTAQNDQGTQVQSTLGSAGNELAGAAHSQQTILNKYNADDEAYRQALMNKKEDPNRYWNSLDTPSKIGATLGMIFSGFGSGITGQPNMAIQMLDKHIDQDIAAQRQDKSNTMNLWKMNREKMGNELAADLATKNALLTATQVKADAIKSGFSGKIAQQQSEFLKGGIQQEINKNNYIRSMLTTSSDDTNPETALQRRTIAGVTSPEDAKAVSAEIANARKISSNIQTANQAFEHAAQESKLGNLVGIDSPGQKSLRVALMPLAMDEFGHPRAEMVRMIEQDIVPKLVQEPGTAQSQFKALQNLALSQASQVNAQRNGIDLSKFASTRGAFVPQSRTPQVGSVIRKADGSQWVVKPGGKVAPYGK